MTELTTLEKIIEEGLAYNVGTKTELSPGEKETLVAYVRVIDEGMDTFLAVGAALLGIREGKLYRETHSTFEAFCRDKWSMSRPRAYQLIASVKVVNNLSRGMMSTMVGIPTTERQVRALATLPPGQQTEAWTEAVATAPKGKVTAAHVKVVVDRYRPVVEKPKNEWDINEAIRSMENKAAIAIENLAEIKLYGDPADRLIYGIKIIRWCAKNLTGFDAALKALTARAAG